MDGLQLKYFVLNPTSSDVYYAEASRQAMLAFANQITWSNKKLADDIRTWVEHCDLNFDLEGK